MAKTKGRSNYRTEEGPVDPIDSLLTRDPKLVRLGTMTRKLQRDLRDMCSEEAWRVHLRIEELVNERMFTLADLLLGRAR